MQKANLDLADFLILLQNAIAAQRATRATHLAEIAEVAAKGDTDYYHGGTLEDLAKKLALVEGQWGAYLYAKKVAEFCAAKGEPMDALLLALLEESARGGNMGYTGTPNYLEGYRAGFAKIYEMLAY